MRRGVAAFAALMLAGCAGMSPELEEAIGQAAQTVVGGPGSGTPLTDADISAGLKEALATGSKRAIDRIGVPDGFWAHRDLQIPLPENLKKVEKALRALGQGRTVDDFHLSLNRAAEAAVPEALPIFQSAIRSMTLSDVRQILNGPSNAATEYFRGKTLPALGSRFKPVVMQATNAVGATRKYKDLAGKIGKYATVEAQDLDQYVTDRALNGLFRTLGEEEMKIRRDPAARTSEILRKVFGTKQ